MCVQSAMMDAEMADPMHATSGGYDQWASVSGTPAPPGLVIHRRSADAARSADFAAVVSVSEKFSEKVASWSEAWASTIYQREENRQAENRIAACMVNKPYECVVVFSPVLEFCQNSNQTEKLSGPMAKRLRQRSRICSPILSPTPSTNEQWPAQEIIHKLEVLTMVIS